MLLTGMGIALTLATAEGVARAEEDPRADIETADGADECTVFSVKNTRDLLQWERSQPPVPYRYPREKTVLHAPWGRFFDGLGGRTGELLLATIFPHLGAQLRGNAPAAYVGWPWTMATFGPTYACTRKKGTFVVHGHRAHRLMFEPAIVSSTRGVGFSVRPGYRFVWHPSSWVVGPGVGLGSTVEIKGNQEPFRASLGPEALLHFGACCTSSYFTLAVRYDHYFTGRSRDIVGANLGYTFF